MRLRAAVLLPRLQSQPTVEQWCPPAGSRHRHSTRLSHPPHPNVLPLPHSTPQLQGGLLAKLPEDSRLLRRFCELLHRPLSAATNPPAPGQDADGGEAQTKAHATFIPLLQALKQVGVCT